MGFTSDFEPGQGVRFYEKFSVSSVLERASLESREDGRTW